MNRAPQLPFPGEPDRPPKKNNLAVKPGDFRYSIGLLKEVLRQRHVQ